MNDLRQRCPRLALPFSLVRARHRVWLVAGEDFRYALDAPDLGSWLEGTLPRLDGGSPIASLIEPLDEPRRAQALELLGQLYGERVLVDGPAAARHTPRAARLQVEGTGPLVDQFATLPQDPDGQPLALLCQDRLDYGSALAFNRRCLSQGDRPWLWVSTAPLTRGFVSPLFRPDAGPCLACLVGHFQRLSPAPELYPALAAHVESGGQLQPASFPAPGNMILAQLVIWKLALLAQSQPPAALYRLHVLETASLTLSSHPVLPDLNCPACGRPARHAARGI